MPRPQVHFPWTVLQKKGRKISPSWIKVAKSCFSLIFWGRKNLVPERERKKFFCAKVYNNTSYVWEASFSASQAASNGLEGLFVTQRTIVEDQVQKKSLFASSEQMRKKSNPDFWPKHFLARLKKIGLTLWRRERFWSERSKVENTLGKQNSHFFPFSPDSFGVRYCFNTFIPTLWADFLEDFIHVVWLETIGKKEAFVNFKASRKKGRSLRNKELRWPQ